MKFDEQIHCEEINWLGTITGRIVDDPYISMPDDVILYPPESGYGVITYVSDRLLCEVHYLNGKMKYIQGARVQAEIIELNIVRVRTRNETKYLQLCDDVRWLELDDHNITEE